MEKNSSMIHIMKNLFSFVLPLSFLLGLLLFHFQSSHDLLFLMSLLPSATTIALPRSTTSESSCAGRYVYIHKIPEQFNLGLLRQCRNLSVWTDMCWYVSNSGIGPLLTGTDATLFPTTAWYGSNFSIYYIVISKQLLNIKPKLFAFWFIKPQANFILTFVLNKKIFKLIRHILNMELQLDV